MVKKKQRTITECKQIVKERGGGLRLDDYFTVDAIVACISIGGIEFDVATVDDGVSVTKNRKLAANKAADFAIKYLKKQRVK